MMRFIKLSTFFICLFFLSSSQTTFAQVTIGSTDTPMAGSLLDLKQWAATSTNLTTANKGLMLPRVSLKAVSQLTPLYGGVYNGNGIWTDESTSNDKLSAVGIIVFNVNKDAIGIYSEGMFVWDGEKWIPLQDNSAEYLIDCDNITVNGQYKKRETLDNSNTITMDITVTTGGVYKITSDVVYGISFQAEAALSEGTHTITLQGTGTLATNHPFDITLTAKTKNGSVACVATVPVTYPDMTYAVIGAGGSVYTWAGTPRKTLLDASTQPGGSFSPTGIVRVGKLTQWGSTMTSAATAKNALGWSYFNANGTLDPNIVFPDLILYYSYHADADAQLAQLLSAYINAGGGILFASQDNSFAPVNIMMSNIFGLPTDVAERQVTGSATADDVYPIANLPNDPIINGPFGNLSGLHWGEDNASTGSIILTQLPVNSVQICTAQSESKGSVPLSNSIVWYNNTKNFVYIGDSTGASLTDNSTSAYPTKYNKVGNAYFPAHKSYGPSASTRKEVYNSALELNILAWLIRKAADTGINEH